MLIKKAVGRKGAERKYDLLTILGAYALSQGKTLQRQTLRLICLITARYNWQSDELSVGQGDMARLWSVDTRTVKREMATFRDRGWLVEKRAAARGRVTLYGLGIAQILEDTRSSWEKVGPDLVARLAPTPVPERDPGNVILFPRGAMPSEETIWGKAAAVLNAEQPSIYRAWFAMLVPQDETPVCLILKAPSGFHATYVTTHLLQPLRQAVHRVAPSVQLLQVV
jgi:hypothetical protein